MTPPPLGADRFPCVADVSDCTSVFSTLKIHDLDQVNFQDFQDISATNYSVLHDSPLPPATSYCFQLHILLKSRDPTVAG
jgi:hypothetical protein